MVKDLAFTALIHLSKMLKTYFYSFVFIGLDQIFYSMQNSYCNHYISPPRNHNFQSNPYKSLPLGCGLLGALSPKKGRVEAAANFQKKLDPTNCNLLKVHNHWCYHYILSPRNHDLLEYWFVEVNIFLEIARAGSSFTLTFLGESALNKPQPRGSD